MKEKTRIKMMDANYEVYKRAAKKLAREKDIKYTEALRIVKGQEEVIDGRS